MTREQKIRRDGKALKKYEEKLKKQHKVYMQQFSAYSVNQRRSRAACVGELCLQAIEHVRELNRVKQLMEGSLDYMVQEQKVRDPDGKKFFEYKVAYRVVSMEKAYTDEEIRKEIESTFEKMMAETDEMFPTVLVYLNYFTNNS